jgi:hypothetical protein
MTAFKIVCRCCNRACEDFAKKVYRVNDNGYYGVCKTCGVPVKTDRNLKNDKKLDKAREDYEKINTDIFTINS